jgi:hypothetical protein
MPEYAVIAESDWGLDEQSTQILATRERAVETAAASVLDQWQLVRARLADTGMETELLLAACQAQIARREKGGTNGAYGCPDG